jgi:hypothetical protein
MKDDGLFRDDVSRPSTEEPAPARSSNGRGGGLRGPLRALVVMVALAAGLLVLYGILQVFVCDLREVVFKGASHRAVWLCR